MGGLGRRNEGYYDNRDSVFSAGILIPDSKTFRNFDAQSHGSVTISGPSPVIPDPISLVTIPAEINFLLGLDWC